MFNNKLSFKLAQNLKLSPQLQQAIKILSFSYLELEEFLNEVIEENPLLEKNETHTAITAQENITKQSFTDGNNDNIWERFVDKISFHEQLHQQVCEQNLNEREAILVRILIDCLDDYGYLSIPLNEIIEYSPLELMIEKEELEQALNKLQQFDPAGVGASDLQESLILQSNRLEHSEVKNCVLTILNHHFQLIAKANLLAKLSKLLKFDPTVIQSAIETIHHLNPYPNSGFEDGETTAFISPEIQVVKENNIWVAKSLFNPSVLTINQEFEREILTTPDEIWCQKLKDARDLISNINWCQNNIFRVADFIVKFQQEFFEFGAMAMKPLNLSDIADELDIHVSTVSRSIRKKYLSCPFGNFELKYFLNQGLQSNTDNEETCTMAIKANISEWVQQEDKYKPFSDTALCQKLNNIGINIARRTVSKYREDLNIPPASLRKIR